MQNTVTAIARSILGAQGQNGINGGKPVGRHRLCRIWTGAGGCGALWSGSAFSFGLKSITSTVDGDDLCVVEQAVEYSAGGRDITEEFVTFFDRAIGGHHGRTVLVTTHDNFQQDFAAFLRQDFEPHIVGSAGTS